MISLIEFFLSQVFLLFDIIFPALTQLNKLDKSTSTYKAIEKLITTYFKYCTIIVLIISQFVTSNLYFYLSRYL